MGRLIDADIIKYFKSKIKDYGKDYAFSQEEVLNILERYVIKYAKSTIEVIPRDQYEARLKADMVAMLKRLYGELKMIHERYSAAEHWDEAYGVELSMEEVRKKINAIKGEPYDKRTAQTAD